MSHLTAIAFKNTISEKVLEKILIGDKRHVASDEDEVKNLVINLLTANPPFILGLGEYSGRDRDKLRIETLCTNKFRNSIIGEKFEGIPLSNFLSTSIHSKLARGIGNSYCNVLSYTIMKTILEKNLPTQFAFIHIPKTFDPDLAASEISSMLNLSPRHLLQTL